MGRNAGDRTWSYMSRKRLEKSVLHDFTYRFYFDDVQQPTNSHVFPGVCAFGGLKIADWALKWTDVLMDFDMELVPDGLEQYPGSVVWWRRTFFLGGKIEASLGG